MFSSWEYFHQTNIFVSSETGYNNSNNVILYKNKTINLKTTHNTNICIIRRYISEFLDQK